MLSPRIADINGDRRADLPSVEDFNNSQQYMSRGDGTFDRVTETNSVWTDENGMRFEISDYDKNGDLDILNVNNKDDATLPVQVPCPAAPTTPTIGSRLHCLERRRCTAMESDPG